MALEVFKKWLGFLTVWNPQQSSDSEFWRCSRFGLAAESFGVALGSSKFSEFQIQRAFCNVASALLPPFTVRHLEPSLAISCVSQSVG